MPPPDRLPAKLAAIKRGFTAGQKTFTGPDLVQIDTSNACNLRCACCWTYSPFVARPEAGFLKRRMTLDTYRDLIRDLADLEVHRIMFAGVGDPLTHRDIDDMIDCAKRAGMHVAVTTSGTLLNPTRLERWVGIGLDWLNVSVLGPDRKSWAAMHPRNPPALFNKLYRSLELLQELKRREGAYAPGVGHTHVLARPLRNCAPEAVRMAATLGADSVDFVGMDGFEGIEHLELTRDDLPPLRRALEAAAELSRQLGLETNLDTVRAAFASPPGDKPVRPRMPSIPCYHGWVFGRVMVDGAVYPCCGSVGKTDPIGNIHDKSFAEIWGSRRYAAFRRSGKNLWDASQEDFRRQIGCENCPDIDINVEYHARLGSS